MKTKEQIKDKISEIENSMTATIPKADKMVYAQWLYILNWCLENE